MEDGAIALIRACAQVLVGDDKDNERNLIPNFCVVVSAGAVAFMSSVVVFGSRQKFGRSWTLLASLRSSSKGGGFVEHPQERLHPKNSPLLPEVHTYS